MPTKTPSSKKTKRLKTTPRRLYRSEKDKMIAGVCGGLAEYFSIDPTIVRLAFVLLTLFQGSGLLLYIIMWIIVPEKKS